MQLQCGSGAAGVSCDGITVEEGETSPKHHPLGQSLAELGAGGAQSPARTCLVPVKGSCWRKVPGCDPPLLAVGGLQDHTEDWVLLWLPLSLEWGRDWGTGTSSGASGAELTHVSCSLEHPM